MDEKEKVSLLKDEYLLLQKFYEDFDSRAMAIKGWSSSIAIAAIGVGFYQNKFLWLFAAAASLVFWGLEASWKNFQYSYAPRISALEAAFREDDFAALSPLQVYTSWFDAYKTRGGILTTFGLPVVWFPHLLTFVAGIFLYLFESLKWIQPR